MSGWESYATPHILAGKFSCTRISALASAGVITCPLFVNNSQAFHLLHYICGFLFCLHTYTHIYIYIYTYTHFARTAINVRCFLELAAHETCSLQRVNLCVLQSVDGPTRHGSHKAENDVDNDEPKTVSDS